MKKIIFILVVLLLAVPALATTVTISAEQVGDTNQVEISYVSTGNLPRAFGLNITVDYGVITACTPAMVGECNDVLQGYGIFPGTIQIDEGGNVTDDGDPVAPSDDPGALEGIGTNGITIELGSLYVGLNEPPASGLLCTITVTENCTVTIEGNAARCGEGSEALGVVMEDPAEVVYPTYEPGPVILDCIPTAHPDYADWVLLGKPDSWCNKRQCHGDADGIENRYGPGDPPMFSAWVEVPDLDILIAGFRQAYVDPATSPWIAADFDRRENRYGPGDPPMFACRVEVPDLNILIAYFRVSPVAEDCQP